MVHYCSFYFSIVTGAFGKSWCPFQAPYFLSIGEFGAVFTGMQNGDTLFLRSSAVSDASCSYWSFGLKLLTEG